MKFRTLFALASCLYSFTVLGGGGEVPTSLVEEESKGAPSYSIHPPLESPLPSSQPKAKKPWHEMTAPVLNDLYFEHTQRHLADGYRIPLNGANFPLDCIETPPDWYNLIQRCAEGRSAATPSHAILDDVCFNIAAQLSMFDTSGNDGRPDGQLRHLGREMAKRNIDLNAAADLIKKLGYPVRITISKRKRILDF